MDPVVEPTTASAPKIRSQAEQPHLIVVSNGYFIVESPSAEQLYAGDSRFHLNAQHELVTEAGDHLLGHGVDQQFNILPTTLVPLTIPLGVREAVQATENVVLEGTLTPTGDLADTAEVIRTGILGDRAWTAPDATAAGTALTAFPQPAGTTTGADVAGGTLAPGNYQYRVVFGDNNTVLPPLPNIANTQGTPSAATGVINLAGPNATINLSSIPVDGTATFDRRYIYRSSDGGTTYQLAGTILDNVTTVFTDTGALTGANLNTDFISGAYSYYVTFATAPGRPGTGTESRPAALLGPTTAVNGRIRLSNLPVDASGQWNVRRIYRNLASDDSTFYYVGEITDATTAGVDFTDGALDAAISVQPQLDLDGPKITNSTLLTNVLRREGSTYNQVFQPGTLAFTGRKGGRLLSAKTLTIDAATTVLELRTFMQQALGIRSVPGPDPLNPIPDGDPSATTVNPGGSVTSAGQIQFVSNNGLDNAIDIGVSGLQLTPTGSTTDAVILPFGSSQAAVGESAVTDFLAYDSLGIPLSVRLTMVQEGRDSSSTTYRWIADSADNDPATGVSIAVGTGLLTFDGQGNFVSSTEATVSIDRHHVGSESPLEFELGFSQISGLATDNSNLAISRQDGSAPGVLTGAVFRGDGFIRGIFSNGLTRDLGRIRLARFDDPAGLEPRGNHFFAATVDSGPAINGNPADEGFGAVTVVEALGPIDFFTLDDLNLSTGDLWYRVQTTHQGLLTLEAAFSGSPENVELTLYDEDRWELAASTLQNGRRRIDWETEADRTYYFRLAGNVAGVDLRLANLVRFSLDGSQITVYDTAGDDLFEAFARSSLTVAINGVRYHSRTATRVLARAEAGGVDVAKLYDSPGDDLFVATPVHAAVSGDGFSVVAESFEAVHAYATAGGLDVAKLFDSPGDDTFFADPGQGVLYGPGFYNRAKHFEAVHAYASAGGSDAAALYDSAGDDRFYADPIQGALYGTGYYNRAKYFDEVSAHAGQGGRDTADLYDSSGDDQFVATPASAALFGEAFHNRAVDFDGVHAYATAGGLDVAWLFDSPGDDSFVAGRNSAC